MIGSVSGNTGVYCLIMLHGEFVNKTWHISLTQKILYLSLQPCWYKTYMLQKYL